MIYLNFATTQIDRFPFDFPIIREVKNKISSIAYEILWEKNQRLRRESHYKHLFDVIKRFEINHSHKEKEWDKNDPIRSYVDWEYILKMRKDNFFRKQFTRDEWEMIHPHVINVEQLEEFKYDMFGYAIHIVKKEEFKKDPFFMIRVAFKISCIFFCIYMAYPMI